MKQNLAGRRYGRWTVVRFHDTGPGNNDRWWCRCDCGTEKPVGASNLRSGDSRSCGCRKREVTIRRSTKHGDAKAGREAHLYRIWQHMRRRCTTPTNQNYARYGGRGITICAEWDDYESFRDWAKANGYKPNLTLDRIDNDGPYSPDNCRWADRRVQAQNRSTVRLVTYQGKEQTLPEWAEEYGLTANALRNRLRHGWSMKRALATPLQDTRKETQA